MIEVLEAGVLSTIQDLGRRGHEAYGIPCSGAWDPFLASVANRLVGNEINRPLLEFALVGPSLKFLQDCWVSVVGFSCLYKLNDKAVPEFSAFPVTAGRTLEFGGMEGWFGYISVAGGIQAEKVLDSASTYLAGKIGRRLARGQQLGFGSDTAKYYSISKRNLRINDTNSISILPALHTSLFTTEERKNLVRQEYRITSQSNRMGVLLDGSQLSCPAIVRSAPTLAGTIQITRSGHPIILGPEGPTTGGYPQIAILSRESWTQLAKIRPGSIISFEWTDRERARQLWKYRQGVLQDIESWTRVQ